MSLDIQRQIATLRKIPTYGRYLADMAQRIEQAVNNLGSQSAIDPTRTIPAPDPVQAVNVASNNAGLVHVTHTDNAPAQKGINYFTEFDTDPSFTQPHVLDHGTSRSLPPFVLPNGTYYFRGYRQLPGSLPSDPVNYGGTTPTAVTISGGSALTLLPSTGSGTASPDGQQGASGYGKTLYRGSIRPKRTSGQ